MRRWQAGVLVALCGIFFSGVPQALAAIARCADREALRRHLEAKWHETLTARGVTNGGAVMELFESEDGVSWTLVLSFPNGASCLWAAGEGWQPFPAKQKGRES